MKLKLKKGRFIQCDRQVDPLILLSVVSMALKSGEMPPNKALQTDKGKLSCLLHSQKPRQRAFAAELGS